MPEASEVIALVKAFATVAAIALPVAIVFSLLARGRLLPPQRWRAVTWTGWHCGAACFVLLAVPDLVASVFDPQTVQTWFFDRPVEARTAARLVHLVAGLIALPLVVVAWWLIVGTIGGARPEQLGRRLPRWRQETVLGVVAWLALAPTVYLVNIVTLLIYGALYGSQPPYHPLLELLRQPQAGPAVTVLFLFESAIAAPVREELFFRGILQPWLCRHPRGGALGFGWALLAGVVVRSTAVTDSDGARTLSLTAPAVFVAFVIPVAWCLADWLGRPNPPARLLWLAPFADADRRRRAVLGLFATAVLFANVHSAVWPTPIALFPLGLCLCWLQLRTQRVLAAVVMHALFNAVACVEMLYLVPIR